LLCALALFSVVPLASIPAAQSADEREPKAERIERATPPRVEGVETGKVAGSSRASRLQPTQDLPTLEELERRGNRNYAFQDRLGRALDSRAPTTDRVRAINSLGRYGDASLAEQLRSGLGKESPEIRIATMRALMRLGVASAEPDIEKLYNDKATTGKERAWALRALGTTTNPAQQMPNMISGLDAEEPGVRAAALDSLRKLTGLTQGAKSTLLLPAPDEAEQAAYTERWKAWWEENKEGSPEDWRFNALDAEMPIDRAAAARTIAAEGDVAAVPRLLKRFKREGNYELEDKIYSGVRDALAKALTKLTGRKLVYRPSPERGETLKQWMAHHLAAHDAWKKAYEQRFGEKGEGWISLLKAPEAKTRADTLRSMRSAIKLGDHPTDWYLELMQDSSAQVRNEAYTNMIAAAGIAFPFDADGPARQRELQVERYSEWLEATAVPRTPNAAGPTLPDDADANAEQPNEAQPESADEDGNGDATDTEAKLDVASPVEAGDLKEEASDSADAETTAPSEPEPDPAIALELEKRLLSVFLDPKEQTWGLRICDNLRERENMDRELRNALLGIRSQAALFMVRNGVTLDTEMLVDCFADQVRRVESALRQRVLSLDPDARPSTGLQANLARVFGKMRTSEALPWLLRRLQLDEMAKRQEPPRDVMRVLRDTTVRMTVAASLGEIGDTRVEVRMALLNLLNEPGKDESLRVRIQALYALARVGQPEDLNVIAPYALSNDFLATAHEKIAAVESLAMLAERMPQAYPQALEKIESVIRSERNAGYTGRTPVGSFSDAKPVLERAEYVRAVLIQLEAARSEAAAEKLREAAITPEDGDADDNNAEGDANADPSEGPESKTE